MSSIPSTLRARSSATALVVAGRSGARQVRAAELSAARAAVAALPAADRRLLARSGLRVELVPASSLEQGMLGATGIARDADGRWGVTAIRVASRLQGRGAESLGEVVQHEVGHAVSVLRSQDRSESAAHRYARRW